MQAREPTLQPRSGPTYPPILSRAGRRPPTLRSFLLASYCALRSAVTGATGLGWIGVALVLGALSTLALQPLDGGRDRAVSSRTRRVSHRMRSALARSETAPLDELAWWVTGKNGLAKKRWSGGPVSSTTRCSGRREEGIVVKLSGQTHRSWAH